MLCAQTLAKMKSILEGLALLSILLVLAAGQEYDFLYYIYYSDSECNSATAGVVGKVAGESFVGVGGRSADGICSEEAICLMDDQSELCQSLARTANGTVDLDVDDFGVIVECKLLLFDGLNETRAQCIFQQATTPTLTNRNAPPCLGTV